MAKSRKKKEQPTDAQPEAPVEVTSLPPHAAEPVHENPATAIIEQLAASTRIDPPATDVPKPPTREELAATHDEVAGALKQHAHPTDDHPTPLDTRHVQREQARRSDPWDFNQVRFPDGYCIRLQESDSRRTVEIQFGTGGKDDRPQNFAAIKEQLNEAGMRWNGTNAWVVELHPERGSFHQREEAKQWNKELRAHIEETVFPAIIGLEEQVRGVIEFTDEFRQRIARAGNGR